MALNGYGHWRARVLQLGPARFLICVLALTWASASATPRIPEGDAVVLEHVPAAAAARELEPLRRAVATNPGDLKATLALARGYLDIGRANGDPRFVSYAQAVLDPWLARNNPDANLLTLGATVRQYLHDFNPALALLERALRSEPLNADAWVTKATILQVQGRFDEARVACTHLVRPAGPLIAITCLTGVDSLTGKLEQSLGTLRAMYDDDPRLPRAIRIWVLDELGEMAVRAGDRVAAEEYLRRSLAIAPADPYSRAEFADLLLLEGRNGEVIDLLQNDEAQDNLLLRLALATAGSGSSTEHRWAQMFQERYEAARRDGDFTHLREQARFLLGVRHDPVQALAVAERNWQAQREPADVRIYAAAAREAHDSRALQAINDWVRAVHYQDRTLGSRNESGSP
jgi:Tfp pilus assembly protein PilF